MAKGDMGGSNSANGTGVAPKTDQYSVMHKIMDMFNGGSSIAPTQMPSMGGSMPMNGGQTSFLPGDQFNPQPKPMGGRFGTMPVQGGLGAMYGVMGGSPLAPSNPQDMMRRSMTSNRTFGQ